MNEDREMKKKLLNVKWRNQLWRRTMTTFKFLYFWESLGGSKKEKGKTVDDEDPTQRGNYWLITGFITYGFLVCRLVYPYVQNCCLFDALNTPFRVNIIGWQQQFKCCWQSWCFYSLFLLLCSFLVVVCFLTPFKFSVPNTFVHRIHRANPKSIEERGTLKNKEPEWNETSTLENRLNIWWLQREFAIFPKKNDQLQ